MGTLVTTYPIGEEVEMVRIVRYEGLGINRRPVYINNHGQEWVKDLDNAKPWFSKIIEEEDGDEVVDVLDKELFDMLAEQEKENE